MTTLPPTTARPRRRPAPQPEIVQRSSLPPAPYARVWAKRPSPLWCRTPASRSSSGPRWRTDLAESVFLGTAILRLGRHLFGDDWSDADMQRTYIAPEGLAETGTGDEAATAWKRIHLVFDTISRTAEAGQLEMRVDIGRRSLLWTLMRSSADHLAICPRQWFAQPALEHLYYDCRLDAIEPYRDLESHHALRHEVFVDRAGLERMMENHFWGDSARSQWPRGDAEHVFFGEALLRVGRAKFGGDWRDDAPTQPFPPTSPTLPDPAMEATDRFLATRQYIRDVAGDRTRQALADLMEAAREGKLRFYTSEHLRRAYDPCPTTWWVAGDWQHLLKGGTLNVAAPQSVARPLAGSRLLFVDAGGLDQLYPPAASTPGPPGSSGAAPADEGISFDPDARRLAIARLAQQLDGEGVAIRAVKASVIAERWSPEHGPAPKVEAITSGMTGGQRGRPRA